MSHDDTRADARYDARADTLGGARADTAGDDPADPLDLQASLDLAEQQRRLVERELDPRVSGIYAAWGTAWLVGFGLFALTSGSDPVWGASPAVAGVVLAVLLAGASALTVHRSARAARGVSGPGQLAGTLYAWSWLLGFACLTAVLAGVARLGVEGEAMALLWSAGPSLLVGLLYLAGGAVWRDVHQYALGAWFLLTTGVGALLGLTGLYTVLALAGGGGLLVAAAVTRRRDA